MARYHQQFEFPFTIMLGDNLYEGVATPEDYRVKFEQPYKALLDRGVQFYAALGNHDDPRQVHYEQFNMKGRRYYSFAPPGNTPGPGDDAGGVLRLGLDLPGPRAVDVAGPAAQGVGGGVEDLFPAPPALHLRPLPPGGAGPARQPRGAVRDPRRRRGVLGARAHLPAVHAAERHPVFRQRRRGLAAARRRGANVLHRAHLLGRLSLHAGGDRRRRPALPGDLAERADHRRGHAVARGPAAARGSRITALGTAGRR